MVNDKFQPFRLRASLLTPIVIGDTPPHLDGLLSYAVWAHTGISDIDALNDYMAEHLLLRDETHQVFHGSAMQLGVSRDNVLRRKEFVRPGRLRTSELSDWYFAPNGAGGKYVKATADGGPKAPRLDKFKAIEAQSVVFYGVGDRLAVAQLLTHFIWSIGKNARAGVVGEIDQFTSEPIEEDLSLLAPSGKPNRNLPAHPDFATQDMPVNEGRLSTPYFNPAAEQSIVPVDRIMKCED